MYKEQKGYVSIYLSLPVFILEEIRQRRQDTLLIFRELDNQFSKFLLHVYDFILVIFRISLAASCQSGWMTHESTCYFFSHTTASWADAESICRGFSGKLAEPRTLSAASFISGEAINLGGWFWLGMSDIITERRWIYSSDQSSVTVNYWGSGEPNAGADVNCLATWPSHSSMWCDESCEYKFKYVCEKPEWVNQYFLFFFILQ